VKNNLFSGLEYGSLQGIVRDEKIAKPLKRVPVEVADLAGVVAHTTAKDDEGHYLIESLKTGNYIVKFTASLHRVDAKNIKSEKNIWPSINVDLVPEIPQTEIPVAEAGVPVARNIQMFYVSPSFSSPAAGYGAMPHPGAVSPADYARPAPFASYGPPPQRFSQASAAGYPESYGDSASGTSQASSQSSAIAEAGAQLLQTLLVKKSETSVSSTSNSSSG